MTSSSVSSNYVKVYVCIRCFVFLSFSVLFVFPWRVGASFQLLIVRPRADFFIDPMFTFLHRAHPESKSKPLFAGRITAVSTTVSYVCTRLKLFCSFLYFEKGCGVALETSTTFPGMAWGTVLVFGFWTDCNRADPSSLLFVAVGARIPYITSWYKNCFDTLDL